MTNPVSLETPIGDAAKAHPVLLDLFDRLGLDYCCGGRVSLSQACQRSGLDPATVFAEVTRRIAAPPSSTGAASADTAPDVTFQGITALCDEIEATHHAFARSVLDALAELLPRIASAHAAAHPQLGELEPVVNALRKDMIEHMVREERVLFPWLRRLETPGAIHVGPPWSVQRPIDCMVHDHEDVAAALARLRRLTAGYSAPSGTCISVQRAMHLLAALDRDTRRHIHKENNILFPAGLYAERRRACAPQTVGSGAARWS